MIKIEWVMGLGSVCKTMHDNPGVVQIDYERWMDLPKDEKKAMLRQAYNLATDMQVNTALRKQGVKWIDIPMTNYPYEDMRGVPDLTDECPLCGNAETCKECEPPLKYAELKPIKAEMYDVHRAIKDFAVAVNLPLHAGLDQIKYLVRRYPILFETREFAAWARKYHSQFLKGE